MRFMVPAITTSSEDGGSTAGTTKPCTPEVAIEDDEAPEKWEEHCERHLAQGVNLKVYLLLCHVTVLCTSATSAGLWSDVGCGRQCLAALQSREAFAPAFFGLVGLVLFALYVHDFFCPQHLPGKHLALFEGDTVLGRSFLVVAAIALLVALYLSAASYPMLPLMLTIFTCPALLMLLRVATMPKLTVDRDLTGQQVAGMSAEERKDLLRRLALEERDQKDFYTAATAACVSVGLLCLALWLLWAAAGAASYDGLAAVVAGDEDERALAFVGWVAPLVVALSDLVFACLAGLRLYLNRAYTATDEVRNRLIIGDATSPVSAKQAEARFAALMQKLATGLMLPEAALRRSRDKRQGYLVEHIKRMQQLSSVVKTVVCAFVVLLGALHITFQLTSPSRHIALTVQAFAIGFFLTFLGFVFVSLGRLWKAMGSWLVELPLCKSLVSAAHSDAARGVAICVVLPAVPSLVVLSFANQQVRACRGLAKDGGFLTARFSTVVGSLRSWNWTSILAWLYLAAAGLMLYRTCPIALNVFLSWMMLVVQRFNFALVVAFTFLLGMLLFLLPPVPGPPIFVFSGIVVAEACPWGFWWGTIISVLVCFLLRLASSIVQQKGFGELLGTQDWVRRTVGVHQPLVRAVEAVLRQPGLSYGKVAVLCGGPEWPTAVLTGILKLSLWQVQLGTAPVLISIIPLSLAGSFYLRRHENELWLRASNLMFTLTAVVSVIFWAGMGWAIQTELDRHHEELAKPREEDVALEWLDFKELSMAERCTVRWNDVPYPVAGLYLAGALCSSAAGHMMLWFPELCFGSFEVEDDIRDLRWLGKTGLIHPAGGMALLLGAVSHLGLVVYCCWHRIHTREPLQRAAQELTALEVTWKERQRQLARAALAAGSTPKSISHESSWPAIKALLPPAGDESSTDVLCTSASEDQRQAEEAEAEPGVAVSQEKPQDVSEGTEQSPRPPSGSSPSMSERRYAVEGALEDVASGEVPPRPDPTDCILLDFQDGSAQPP